MKEDLTIYAIKFQNGLITKRFFLNKINPIILKIPYYLGYKSLDIKHEFYAYIISKIDKIISLYKVIPNIKFITWFNVVLKREFIYYINKINNYNEFESIHINEIKNNYLLQYQESSLLSDKYNIDLSILTEKEKDVIALKYGIKIYKRNIDQSINQILKKLDKKRDMERTISKKYFKMIKLQNKIANTENNEEKTILKKELDKILYYKRKLEYIFNNYSILPTNKWVGEQLGLSDNTVAVYLNKIKKKLLENTCT